MFDLSPNAFNLTVAAVGLLLYLFAWRVTRDLPPAAKVFSRLSLAVVAIVPILLGVFFGASTPKLEKSSDAAPPASQPGAGQPTGAAEQQRQAEAEAARRSAEEARAAAERMQQQQQRQTEAARPRSTTGELPPAPPPVAVPESAPTRSPPPSPAGAPAPAPSDDYDVVPVFYGTDRGAKPDAKRLNYDFERARRLELGRAMVTVPKAHEVPTIERPWAYRIPLTNIVIYQESEDPKKHFTMQEVKALSREEYLKLVHERLAASSRFKDHAVVFIHGFNTTFDFAVYRTAQMAYDLKFDGAPFMYSWPSKGQFGFQDYEYDRGSAEQADPYLKDFLNLVTTESGAKTVSVIAHSMGNLVLLPVLRDLKNAAPEGVKISQIILAAPDVDRDRFVNLAAAVKGYAKGTTLYVASNDRALELSKRINGRVARAGDSPTGGPLILPDIDTIDVTATSTDFFALNHSGYAERTALINDIQLIIQTGERPPDNRVPILKKETTDRGVYWRYP
jgi:esterase/lipase superfamily enzyme